MRKEFFCFIIATALSFSVMAAKHGTNDAGFKMPPVIVKTIQPKMIPYQKTIQATGSLAAMESTTITPEITGRIVKINFKSGQFIKKNDAIIKLDDAILKAQLKKARAQLQLSKTNYQRFLKLYKEKFFGAADLDKVRATLKSAQADVDQIQAQFNKTLIRAPFDGKLGLKQISLGDYVSPGTPIVNLQALNPIRVDFSVPETYLIQIKPGNKITIRSQAFLNKTYTGIIYALASDIDKDTRTLSARAKIPNQTQQLLPGTFVEVTVYLTPEPTKKSGQAMVIPQTAIMYETDGNYVYLLKNHKPIKTTVKLGSKLTNNQIIILSGLKLTDTVITEGQMKIHEGSNVMTEKEAQQQLKGRK